MNPAIKLLAAWRNFHTVNDPCSTNKAGIRCLNCPDHAFFSTRTLMDPALSSAESVREGSRLSVWELHM